MTKTPSKKTAAAKVEPFDGLYSRVREILEDARSNVVRTVDSTIVRAYWLVGREIVEEELGGKDRADYGKQLIAKLSQRLQKDFGKGFTQTNLKYMRLFYQAYPRLLDAAIGHAVRDESGETSQHTTPDESEVLLNRPQNPNLSWTHYRILCRVESPYARAFYEAEAAENRWSSRELERQIGSLLFERLAKSRDKAGLMRLALKGQEIQTPEDAIKDPVVLEFLGLPESNRLVETDLEQALIGNLQDFLLELGKGFAFVARQRRLTLDGDHFYVDLVFYHAVLKCYVLIDLKMGKLTHADLGQMQLYVNYFDEEVRTEGDNPTVGLVLCADKNDMMVKYMLAKGRQRIFASRYKLHLPDEKVLADELAKTRRQLEARLPDGKTPGKRGR